MEESMFRISAPVSVMAEIKNIAEENGATCSMPQPASSTADPLNAPISGGDIQAAAEVLTVIFTTGTAGLKFFEQLRKLVKTRDARIKVSNVTSGVSREIRGDSDDKDLSA